MRLLRHIGTLNKYKPGNQTAGDWRDEKDKTATAAPEG
jgi:hypothetical protein